MSSAASVARGGARPSCRLLFQSHAIQCDCSVDLDSHSVRFQLLLAMLCIAVMAHCGVCQSGGYGR